MIPSRGSEIPALGDQLRNRQCSLVNTRISAVVARGLAIRRYVSVPDAGESLSSSRMGTIFQMIDLPSAWLSPSARSQRRDDRGHRCQDASVSG